MQLAGIGQVIGSLLFSLWSLAKWRMNPVGQKTGRIPPAHLKLLVSETVDVLSITGKLRSLPWDWACKLICIHDAHR